MRRIPTPPPRAALWAPAAPGPAWARLLKGPRRSPGPPSSRRRGAGAVRGGFSNTTVQKHQFFRAQLSLWFSTHIQPRSKFANKGPSSQSCDFLVVMYGCESWTVKKAEHQRIDTCELWCWRRLLQVPWTARRSNQSTLQEISPGCSLEGLMLKLKLQYFGHLMWGKIEGRRRRG